MPKQSKSPFRSAVALLAAVLAGTGVQAASVPTGFQEYFVVGREQQLWDIYEFIGTSEGGGGFNDGVNSVVSATASADNQIVYYDHWEDGFETEITDPTAIAATTLILGNLDASDGTACDFTTDPRIQAICAGDTSLGDVLFQGSFVNFNSDQGLEGAGCATPGDTRRCTVPVNPRGTAIRFDGGDRLLTSGGPIALVHPNDPMSPFIGGATEILSRQSFSGATSYTIPIGEDSYAGNNSNTEPFKYVYLDLVAFEDDTDILINSPGAGTVSITLDRGQHYSSQGFIDETPAPAITINAGTKVSNIVPVGGVVVTGGDGTYATRLFALLPQLLYGTDYMTTAPGDDAAVNGNRPLNLYIFNPDPINSLTVRATDSQTVVPVPGPTAIVVNPLSEVDYQAAVGRYVPAGSTVRLTSDRPFWGFSAYDHQGSPNDWGHSWLGTQLLTDTYTVSYAPGVNNPATVSGGQRSWGENQVDEAGAGDDDPDCVDTTPFFPAATGVCNSLNRSPVFVSAIQDRTQIRVDFENDGVYDLIDTDSDDCPDQGNATDASCPLIQDTNYAGVCGLPATGPTNCIYEIDALQSLRVYDYTDYDNTGTFITTNKAAAMAYGEDTDQATGPDPIQDTGFIVFPVNEIFLDTVLKVDKQVNVTTVPLDTGGTDPASRTATYTITVTAGDFSPITAVSVSDLLPPGIAASDYVTGSTTITYPNLTQGNADPVGGTEGTRETLEWALSWQVPPLAANELGAGQSITVQYSILIPPGSSPQLLSNEGRAEGQYRRCPTCVNATFSPTDTADLVQTDVTLAKAVDESTPAAGDVIEFSLFVANTSSSADETGVTITDPIPVNTTFCTTSVPACGLASSFITDAGVFTGAFDPAQNAVVWTNTGGDFTFGTGVPVPLELKFKVVVNPGVPAGTEIPNRAGYESNETPFFLSNRALPIVAGPSLAISKSFLGASPLHVGQTATFAISVENTGSTAATNVLISDPFPFNGTYVAESMSWQLNAGPFASLTDAADADQGTLLSDRVELSVASLGAGQSVTFRFSVTVDAGTGGQSVVNQATVSAAEVAPDDTNLVGVPIADGDAAITGHVFLDVNRNGVQDGSEPDLAGIDVVVTPTSNVTSPFSCNPGVAIPDDNYDGTQGSMTCCTISPSGFSDSTILDVDLDVSLDHTWVGDLTIKLYGPNPPFGATPLTVLNRPGSAAPDDGSNNNGDSTNWTGETIRFDDDGGGPSAETLGAGLAGGGNVCQDDGICNYVPAPDTATSPPAGLSFFDGGAADAGNWQVCVADSAGGDTGTFNSATLTFTTPGPPSASFTVTTDGSGNYSTAVPAGSVTVNVDETDPDFPPTATLTTANDPQSFAAVGGVTTAAADVGYGPPVAGTPILGLTKTSNAGGDVTPGQTLTYTIKLTNFDDGTLAVNDVSDALPDGTSAVPGSTTVQVAATPPFRVTEYLVAPGSFTGTTYDLTLDQDLSADYFVIVQGAETTTSDTGPDSDYARLAQDPFGTGELAVSTGSNVIGLQRDDGANDWAGVVSVVECVADCDTAGFRLRDAREVAHGSGNATGNEPVAAATWADINQVQLVGGYNGAGCETPETTHTDHPVCHARLFPENAGGTGQRISWTRTNTANSAISTVMVVEWGSEWTVQNVRVTGTNGGNGLNAVGEWNTAALGSSVARDNTWVWGAGWANGGGIGSQGEGVAITLGNGVNQNASETTVAVGTENGGTGVDFQVWALTHPSLAVDYRFKADGDSGNTTVDVTVDAAGAERMALVYNGQDGTSNNYPRPLLSARYIANDTVRLERQRTGSDFPAWVQGIDFTSFGSASSQVGDDPGPTGSPANLVASLLPISLGSGQTLTITFQVTIDDPLDGSITQIFNQATAQSGAVSASVTDDVVRPAVDVEFDNANFGLVGEVVVYTHTVTNTGTIADSYTLTPFTEKQPGTCPDGGLPADPYHDCWGVQLYDPDTGLLLAEDLDGDGVWDGGVTIDTGTLAPGASKQYELRVLIRDGAPADEQNTASLTATSDRSPNTAFDTATDETTVLGPSGFGTIAVVPDNSGVITSGGTMVYTHRVYNLTGSTDTIDLRADSTVSFADPGNWTATIYWDTNGDGVYTDGVDVAIANTKPLAPNESQLVFVVIDDVSGHPAGTLDVTTLTGTSRNDPNLIDSATDTTTVEQATSHDLSGGGTQLVDPGTTVYAAFPGTLRNLSTAAADFDFFVGESSLHDVLKSQVYPTQLWIDTDADGVADLQIARDDDGDGTWDFVDATYDAGGLTPRVTIPGSSTLAYELRRPVDPDFPIGREFVSLTVMSVATGETDSITTTMLSALLTRASILGLRVQPEAGVVEFATGFQQGTRAFEVYETDDATGETGLRRLTSSPLRAPVPTSMTPILYRVETEPIRSRFLVIEELEVDGDRQPMGPFEVGDVELRQVFEEVEARFDTAGVVPVAGARLARGSQVKALRRNEGSMPGLARGLAQHDVAAETAVLAAASAARVRNRQGARVEVSQAGQVDVPLSELDAVGVDVSNPNALRVRSQTKNVPAWVSTGPGGLQLSFVSEELSTDYTGRNVYVVTSGRAAPRQRVALTRSGDPKTPGARRLEQSWVYLPDAEQGSDPWLWDLLFGDGSTWPYAWWDPTAGDFDVPGLDPVASGSVAVRVKVLGYADDRHTLDVKINGVSIGAPFVFEGRQAALVTGSVPASTLHETGNQVTIGYSAVTLEGGTADPWGLVYLDYVEIDAPLAPAPAPVVGYDAITPYDPSLPRMNRVEYLVVTHPLFRDQAERVADAKRAEGLRTVVVDTDTAYDLFSAGIPDPNAIQALIRHVARKSRRLEYVLLVGDDTFDPRDFIGTGAASYVPSLLVWDSGFGRVPSENPYADLDDDGLPDLAIGRLPVQTLEQARIVVDKIVAQSATLDAAGRNHLLASDNHSSKDVDFQAESESVSLLMPTGSLVAFANIAGGIAGARATLDAAWLNGALTTQYFGHGGPEKWADEGLLTMGRVAALEGNSRPTVVFTWGCQVQWYLNLWGPSINEALMLVPDGGALASFGPSGVTSPAAQQPFYTRFYENLYSGTELPLGQVLMLTKREVLGEDPVTREAVEGFNLFGDPALRLRVR